MPEEVPPPIAAEAHNDVVVKWRGAYFTARRDKWVPVQLISQQERAVIQERTSRELGIGMALVLAPVMWGVVGTVTGLNGGLATLGLDVLVTIAYCISAAVGLVLLVAGFMGWLRLRREVAVAHHSSLWGFAEVLSGMPRFIDFDQAHQQDGAAAE